MALAMSDLMSRMAAMITAIKNMSWQKRILLGLAGITVIVLIVVLLARLSGPKATLKLAAVTSGGLRSEITASGTLQPNNTVEVGTQVSGTISKLFVDYNSRVRRGQLIAQLDTTFLAAAANDAGSSLQKAQAQLTLAAGNKRRADSLLGQQLISQADQESAAAQYEAAQADRNSATAQLERARINLNYASIRSPIDGIVISRNVEVGQTVAASLNTPTLFVIADDLRKMRVSATVDEGDIGKVAMGQRVEFTVDAYPDETFDGTVSKIYLQPTTVQNVVSYTTIIDISNKDLKLLPGMTANITVITQAVDSALLVPAAALNFQPVYTKRPKNGARPDSARSKRSGATAGQWAGRKRQPSDTVKGGARAAADSAGRGQGQWGNGGNRVFIFKDKKLQRVPVRVLLNNGIFVAVAGALAAGDSVAVGYNNQTSKAKAAVNPFQQQRPGGRRN
jgi:HlyD family secretion protein